MRCGAWNNEQYGFILYQDAYDIYVVHCTIHGNGDAGLRNGWVAQNEVADKLRIKNNISTHNGSQDLKIEGSVTFELDYNNWYGAPYAPSHTGSHSRAVNPQYVYAATNNYHLSVGSPCIDAGGPVTYTTRASMGTNIPVADAFYFTDGMGMTAGDIIRVGGMTAQVIEIPNGTTIVTDASLTWNAGQGVYFDYNEGAPDLGKYETVPEAGALGAAAVAGVWAWRRGRAWGGAEGT